MALLELTTFRLAPGVDEADFLVTDKAVQTEFFYRQTGLARRTTARASDGEWLVVLLWGTDADASAAASRAEEDPAVGGFSRLIDAGSVVSRRYGTLD